MNTMPHVRTVFLLALLALAAASRLAAAQAPETAPPLPVLHQARSWPNAVIGGLQILSGMFGVWLASAAYRQQGTIHNLETERDLWRERALDHGWQPHDRQRDRSDDEPPVNTP